MVTGSNDVDEIYHRMAVIRRELHTNVRESVAGAEAVVDWGRYTWTYPWIALGAAVAAGYLIYSGGHQKATADNAGSGRWGHDWSTGRGGQGHGSGTIEDRPESPDRHLGHLVPRGRSCGAELRAAMARTTIPDEDHGSDRSAAIGWGAGRPGAPRGAVGD